VSFTKVPLAQRRRLQSASEGRSGQRATPQFVVVATIRGCLCLYGWGMPSPAVDIQAAGRTLRVSNPDRVMYPATDKSPAVTKLDVVTYYMSVADGIMTAVRHRPTTLERWPKGVVEGVKLATRADNRGDAFYQKRVPKGAPPYVETAQIAFPSGRFADEVCPTEPAVVAWAAQLGTITFHPWPVRRDDVDHPDEMRIDLDPQPGTDFADAVRVAIEARGLLGDLGYVGFPKTSGKSGLHIYLRVEPRWTFTDVRHAAIAFGRELERRMPGQVTTKWWKEERGERIFVDFNQNSRDRTIASAYSLRPLPWAPVSTPLRWEELDAVDPRDLTIATVPARYAEIGDPHAEIDSVAHSLEPLLEMYARDEAAGLGDMPYPPEYPKMPGEPKRVQPSRDRDRPKETDSE
jgi:DNA ligase D-like protein (predicted polymerase)